MSEVAHPSPEREHGATVDLTVVFARGALRSRLAAQQKIQDALLEVPAEQRSRGQSAALAYETARLTDVNIHPDNELLKAWCDSLVGEMDRPGLSEDRVHALFDEAEALFGYDTSGVISSDQRDAFYRLNNAYFGVAEITAASPVSLSSSPTPLLMPLKRGTHPAVPPGTEARDWEMPPVGLEDRQTVLDILADGNPHHVKWLLKAVFGSYRVNTEKYNTFVDLVLKPLLDTGLVAYDRASHHYQLVRPDGATASSDADVRRPRRRAVRLAHKPEPETPDDVARRARQAGIQPAHPKWSMSINNRTARTGVRTR